jgi:hypothetical protein
MIQPRVKCKIAFAMYTNLEISEFNRYNMSSCNDMYKEHYSKFQFPIGKMAITDQVNPGLNKLILSQEA